MKITRKITLVQPRHIYAPPFHEKKMGHIYMPTSLLTGGAILKEAGLEIEFIDKNITDIQPDSNLIGLNLIGAPYIPVAQQCITEIKEKHQNLIVFLGGQVINGLRPSEFKKLFGNNVINGNNNKAIAEVLNIEPTMFPLAEKVSLNNVYNLLPDDILKLYLSTEFSFYLSQGCKYSCTFCAAKRTGYHPIIDKNIKIKEVYRDILMVEKDLEYIICKAKSFGLSELLIYLSNLDLFQTPDKLYEFSIIVNKLKNKYPEFQLKIRGLSTVHSFLATHSKSPFIITEMIKAGLYQVGFGIDGATYDVYKLTKKPQTIKECLAAIRISKEVYGIIPETLMVFGHNYKEDISALNKAYEFCLEMSEKYNALPRPHVAKDIVPGNDGWFSPENEQKVNQYIFSPWLFQNLDFTALPSAITHPDPEFRSIVEKVYLEICSLPNSLTQYVKPYNNTPNLKTVEFNREKYDI